MIVVALAFVASVLAVLGVDVSSSVSSSVASCFVNNGYKYVIVHAYYCENGGVNTGSASNFRVLRSAGMAHVGAYLYPCVGRSACPSAWQQVQSVKSFFDSQGISPDSFWLDIESGGVCPWSSSTGVNQNFVKSLVQASQSLFGNRVGIYSSYYMWESIFGSASWNPGFNLPLWYAHYDGAASFGDWMSFGSWSSPFVKQYTGDSSVCGFDVDQDWAPSFPAGSWAGGAPPHGGPLPPPPPHSPTSCTYGGVGGVCTDSGACGSMGGSLHPSSQGANGCQALADNIQCCVRSGGGGATACSYGGQGGTCVDQATCSRSQGSLHSSASGANGCQALPSNIMCCTHNGAAPPPPPSSSFPCTYNGAHGRCTDENECLGMQGLLHSSASGANGCQTLPDNIMCCIGGIRCTYKGHAGVCQDTSSCAGTYKASSQGANGCQALPDNVECCFTGVANLEEQVAPAPAPFYSSQAGGLTSAALAGIIVSAIVVVLIVAIIVGVFVALKRRSTSMGASETTTTSAISLNEERAGAPTFL